MRLAFYDAASKLAPEEIKAMIPMTFPATHILDPKLFPGVAKFPVDDWIAEGRPCWTTASWVAFCIKIAQKDMVNLASVFEVCQKLDTTGVVRQPTDPHIKLGIINKHISPTSSSSTNPLIPPPPPPYEPPYDGRLPAITPPDKMPMHHV